MVHLVNADGEESKPPLVMIFLLGTESSRRSSRAEGVKSEATGCVQHWKNRLQSTWDLKGGAGPPESWETSLQFEAVLDGRQRTLQIGWETYPLNDYRTFVVQFDANLEAIVTPSSRSQGCRNTSFPARSTESLYLTWQCL